MPTLIERIGIVVDAARRILLGITAVERPYFGPLLIDRGYGLLYDVERDITWLQDANYAKTVGRTADGQMTWDDAMAWVAGLSYRGIRGWRLPDARAANGSGPHDGEMSVEGEIGHLFLVAGKRRSPADLALRNFESFSIYWYRNDAGNGEAWGYRLTGLKQGKLAKNPWQSGGITIPLPDKVLAWPVHDGDVAPNVFVRFIWWLTTLFTRRSMG